MTSIRFIITVLCQAGPNQSYDEFTKFVEDTGTKSLNRSAYLSSHQLYSYIMNGLSRNDINLKIGVLTLKLFFSNICALSTAFHAQANGCEILNPNLAK